MKFGNCEQGRVNKMQLGVLIQKKIEHQQLHQ